MPTRRQVGGFIALVVATVVTVGALLLTHQSRLHTARAIALATAPVPKPIVMGEARQPATRTTEDT